MVQNTEEKRMTTIKESFFDKIKNFFKRIFLKNETHKIEPEFIKIKDNFKENIVIEGDTEKIKLLNLQKAFEANQIQEEDLSDEEYKKMHELYDAQIARLKEKIQAYKKEIVLIKKKG